MTTTDGLNIRDVVCEVCKNVKSACVCCPECGHDCPLDVGESYCPVCGEGPGTKDPDTS
jgi:hypothetical protein